MYLLLYAFMTLCQMQIIYFQLYNNLRILSKKY